MIPNDRLTVTSQWFIRPGADDEVVRAVREELVPAIEADEPGTLMYLVHRPITTGPPLASLPPPDPGALLFVEEYSSPESFHRHVTGAAFTGFVARHGADFLQVNASPYTTVTFWSRRAGFVRGIDPRPTAAAEATGNRHPAVMFEVMSPDATRARDFYARVFGWNYETGSEGFSYIHFPTGSPALLGGIGQAEAGTPGMQAGTNFYLLVDDLATTLERAGAAGARTLMPPTTVDGFHFAMFTDPDGFAIGLVMPFPS